MKETEARFINTFSHRSRLIGDDGAVVGKQVYSNDAFIEGTHFKRSWMTLDQIAYKAIAVNVSDAVAMNATAAQMLLAVEIPRHFSAKEVRALSNALAKAADAFDCEIIGGDTVGGDRLAISVTVISETTQPLYRRGIKRGDYIAYTGRVGESAKALRYLLAGGKVHGSMRFMRPQLRAGFIRDATRRLHAGMDVSDGIFTDLGRLARLNRTGFRFMRPLPRRIGCSGEEYEMLIAYAPRQKVAVRRLAAKHRLKLNVIAKAAPGRYTNPCKSHHF